MLRAVRERADRHPGHLAGPYLPRESPRQRGRFDTPGAITGTADLAALVYGLSNAGTDQADVSDWGDTKVAASLAAMAVRLASFAVLEGSQPPHACCRCTSSPTVTTPTAI